MRPRPQPKRARNRRACPTGKHRFPDKRAAVDALHTAQLRAANGEAHRRECRAYQCGKCGGGWHLTSQPGR